MARIQVRVVAAAFLMSDLATCMLLALVVCHAAGGAAGWPLSFALAAMLPVLWLGFAYATSLYRDEALRAGRIMSLSALATALLASAPVTMALTVSGTSSLILKNVELACLVQAVSVVFLRCVWGAALGVLLTRGYCLEKLLVLSDSFSASRMVSAAVERHTGGRKRVAVIATLPRQSEGDAVAWLESAIAAHHIDQVLLADTGGVAEPARQIGLRLAQAGTDVAMVTVGGDIVSLHLRATARSKPKTFAGWQFDAPLSRRQKFCKRAIDIVLAGGALLFLAPLMILIALCIRLDSPGPIMFRQVRQGFNAKPFEILKFRSMYAHMADLACVVQTRRGDPRVTRAGRVLRSTSLDELPQLLNVLRGDMSLIGPRPHAVGMLVENRPVTEAIRGYAERLRVKPGITGWAQVNGSRGEVTTAKALRQRVALDRTYIENWSLLLDLKILVRTLSLVFIDERAF